VAGVVEAFLLPRERVEKVLLKRAAVSEAGVRRKACVRGGAACGMPVRRCAKARAVAGR